jgi:hypothetical protein
LLLEAEQLATESEDVGARIQVMLMRSTAAAILGRLRESVDVALAGEALCRRLLRGADWEIVAFQQNLLVSLALAGDLKRATVEMDRALREASDRGDRFALSILPVGVQNIVWLAADAPERAEEWVKKAVGRSFESPYPYNVYLGELSRCYIDLYLGNPSSCFERASRTWDVLEKSYLLRMRSLRSNLREVRAGSAIQIAANDPERSDRFLDTAAKEARAMRREHVAWLEARADRIEARVASLRGEHGKAVALLDRAARRFESVNMGLAAAAARWRLADLQGSEDERARSEAWIREHGIRRVEQMIRLY